MNIHVGGGRFRGEVSHGNLEGHAPSFKAIFLPPIPLFCHSRKNVMNIPFIVPESLKCGPTSRRICTTKKSRECSTYQLSPNTKI